MGAPPEAAAVSGRLSGRSASGRMTDRVRRVLTPAVAAGALAWTADLPVLRAVLTDARRGLDLMDESHYVMAAQPWASDSAFNGVFGWYSGLLLRLAGGDLAALRVLGALLLIPAALVLARAVRRCAESLEGRDWPGWLRGAWPPALVGAAMCYYTVFVRTPSYNWFAALGLMVLAAGLLDATRSAAPASGVLIGLGVFLTAVGKASTAVAALALSLVLFLVLIAFAVADRDDRRPSLRVGPWPVAGSAAATGAVLALAHSVLVASPQTTLTAYRRAAGMLATVDPQHYAAEAMPGVVRAGLRNVLLDRPGPHLTLPVSVIALVAVLIPVLHRSRGRALWWLGVAFALGVAMALVPILRDYPGGVPGLGMSAPAAVVVAECALVAGTVVMFWQAVGWVDGRPRTATAVVLCGVLLLLAVVYPVGTNVEYSTQLHGAFPVLMAAAAIGVALIPGRGREVALGAVTVVALVLGAVLVPVTRQEAPYRIAPLGQQDIARTVTGGTARMLLDADTVAWIDGLRRLAADGGWHAGSPMLDLTWHPASVLVLDGRAPSVLLPAFPGWPDPGGSAAHALRQEDPAIWSQAWLLVPVGQDDALAAEATRVVGRRFPDDYQLLGTVVAAYDRQEQGLWRPR